MATVHRKTQLMTSHKEGRKPFKGYGNTLDAGDTMSLVKMITLWDRPKSNTARDVFGLK